jgi:hypothetical protein
VRGVALTRLVFLGGEGKIRICKEVSVGRGSALSGGAEAGGDGVDGEEEVGEHGVGFFGFAGVAELAPVLDEGDLLEVEFAEGFVAELEGFDHAWAAFFDGDVSEGAEDLLSGELVFIEDDFHEVVAEGIVWE